MATLYESALQLESEKQFEQAFHHFEKLLFSTDVDRGDVLFHCGWCLENAPELDSKLAVFCYQEAAAIAKSALCRLNSSFRAGWLLMHEKNYRDAEKWFSNAIEIQCKTPASELIYIDSLYWRAMCKESQQRYFDALEGYRKVAEIAPQMAPESWFRQIQCLNNIGNFEQALEVCSFFEQSPPKGFDHSRYQDLQKQVATERDRLTECLTVNI